MAFGVVFYCLEGVVSCRGISGKGISILWKGKEKRESEPLDKFFDIKFSLEKEKKIRDKNTKSTFFFFPLPCAHLTPFVIHESNFSKNISFSPSL